MELLFLALKKEKKRLEFSKCLSCRSLTYNLYVRPNDGEENINPLDLSVLGGKHQM